MVCNGRALQNVQMYKLKSLSVLVIPGKMFIPFQSILRHIQTGL